MSACGKFTPGGDCQLPERHVGGHSPAPSVFDVAAHEQIVEELERPATGIPPGVGAGTYASMMKGHRPEGCTCVLEHPANMGSGGGTALPAEWAQDPDCPVHPQPVVTGPTGHVEWLVYINDAERTGRQWIRVTERDSYHATQEAIRRFRVALKRENVHNVSFFARQVGTGECEYCGAGEAQHHEPYCPVGRGEAQLIEDLHRPAFGDAEAEPGNTAEKVGSSLTDGAIARARYTDPTPSLISVELTIDARHAEALYTAINDRLSSVDPQINGFYAALHQIGQALRRAGVTGGVWSR